MINRISRSGFTLGEVMVAVCIMAMMMIALFSYVNFVGQSWIKSHVTISLSSEVETVMDYVERELAQSTGVVTPNIGDPATSTIIYTRVVKDYVASWASARLRMDLNGSSVVATISAAPPTWSVLGSADGANKMNAQRYDFDVARHVGDFKITRVAGGLITLYVRVQNNPQDVGFQKTIEATRTMLLPSM